MFACVEEDRVTHQQFHRLVKPRSPHQHSCCKAVLNSCDTVSRQKVSLYSFVICVSSRAIASNTFVSVALRRVNAQNTARLISVTSAFSTTFTSVTWCGSATRLLCPPYQRVRPTCHSPTSHDHFVVVTDWCRGSCFLRLLHRGHAVRLTVSVSVL